jgi:hypothetical protein
MNDQQLSPGRIAVHRQIQAQVCFKCLGVPEMSISFH